MSRPKGPSLTNLKEFKAPSKEAVAEQRRQMDAELSDNPQFRRALHQVERLNGNVEADGMPVAFPSALPFAEAVAPVADIPRADDAPRTTLEGLGDAHAAESQAPDQSQPTRDVRAKTLLGLGSGEQAPEAAPIEKRVTAQRVGEPAVEPPNSRGSNQSEKAIATPAESLPRSETEPPKRARRWIAGAVLAAALLVGGVAIGWSRLDSSAATSATNTTAALTNGTATTGSPEAVATAGTAKGATATTPASTASATVTSSAVPPDTVVHSSRASVEPMRSESARPSTTHEPAVSTRGTESAVTPPPPVPPPTTTSAKPSVAPPIDTGPGLPFSTHKKGKSPG